MAASGRPFLLGPSPAAVSQWLSTLEQPQPSGRAGWVSAQTCSWQRCMHMGEGPPPLTPWPGAGEGRRDGGSGLGWVPCRTRPPRLRTVGGNNSPPRHAERASVSPVAQIPPQEGSGAWDGRGAPEGWAGGHSGGSLSSAQQHGSWGSLGRAWPSSGDGPCLSPCGGTTWPRAGGQCSH